MNILAIIPARSGSKTVKDKNIKLMAGKPMLAYSIEHAIASSLINRIIVSTDSPKYADIAKEYGAEVPFLRPDEISQDLSTDHEAFLHALNELKQKEDYMPDIVVHLRPTYPIRDAEDIDKMITMLIENKDADSVRSISYANDNPFKMWTMCSDGQIKPLVSNIKDCYNMPRQYLPTAYYQNACIDVVHGDVITDKMSMTGDNIMGYLMSKNFDIDTKEEFVAAESYLNILQGSKTFCFDIDGVIALCRKDLDYSKTQPNEVIISIVNRLYDYGNEIILFTARGFKTGIDWREVTKNQMKEWGVKHHMLMLGKPSADYYIDDHTMTIDTLLKLF